MKQIIAAGLLFGYALGARAAVDWERDYDAALEKAAKQNKLVMVDVYTDWCGWCKKLDRDVYTDKDVRAKLAAHFISVKINPEKTAKNRRLAEQLGVRGYPNIVFLDSTGRKLDQQMGYQPAAQFLKLLDEVVRKAGK